MSTPAKRRLMKDLSLLSASKEQVYAQPLDDDILIWVSVIIGPDNTPFQNGTFTLLLSFDESYPFNPPAVKFLSKMFHPNIYQTGELCLDILKTRWSPTYDVLAVLISIQSLLNDPNVNSPANVQAAELFEKDKDLYEKKILECVHESWQEVEDVIVKNNKEIDEETAT